MKTMKQIGALVGLLFVSAGVFTAFAECCAFCGECEYTPSTTTVPTTTTTTTSTGCLFCGQGTVTSSTTTYSNTYYSDFSKKQTAHGHYFDPNGSLAGTATLEIGKINKKGKVSIKATLKSNSNKKYSASTTVEASASTGTASGTLPFSSKNIGAMSFSLVYEEGVGMTFEGSSDKGYSMSSDDVEPIDSGDDEYDDDYGTLGSFLVFSVDGGDLEFPDDYYLVVDLPSEEPVYVDSKGKWTTNPSPKIKYKKINEDGETYYELTGIDDENKTNYSSLKLSYNSKKGTFSGSFKIYASNEGSTDKKPSLKTYTAKVSGTIFGSHGTGTATVKIGKVKYSLPVTIETVE